MTETYPGSKGVKAEEALRNYFLSIGYYTVRGVPFNYKSFDVTDVDLWLYIKSTSLSRERTCVDSKRKNTPKAMERIFWTKGLREVLGLERAIVATTDNREETRDFGIANGVTVLLGAFCARVIQMYIPDERITEEQLLAMCKPPCVVDPSIIWTRWFRNAKAKLVEGLNFDTCNIFLEDIHLLLREYLATGKNSQMIVRLLYILISYFLISLDYVTYSIAHLELNDRKLRLTEGFRYGEAGRQRTEEVVEMAIHLLGDTGKANALNKSDVRNEFQKQLSDFPAEILADNFSKNDSLKHLFELARSFESLAYASEVFIPEQCSSEQRAIIGVLCDFLGIDRKKVI